jgi:hypothetical protein
MVHCSATTRMTENSLFHTACGTWTGWSFIAQDRELRFVAVELPPPAGG